VDTVTVVTRKVDTLYLEQRKMLKELDERIEKVKKK
jgi:hypothetical protein